MRRLLGLAVCCGLLAACSSPPPALPPLQEPPMGWNSWNSGISLTEQTIDAMVSSGMRDAGYRYVNLDAGWAAPTRDADGKLRADPDRFPHGIAGVARYTHDRGMYVGLYHSPFNEGCGQDPRTGAAGHERVDARVFADWGVDYLKYDWCRMDAAHEEQVRYFTAMRDALRVSGRRIVYSINPNSSGDPEAGAEYDWSGHSRRESGRDGPGSRLGRHRVVGAGPGRCPPDVRRRRPERVAQRSDSHQRSGHAGGRNYVGRRRGQPPHDDARAIPARSDRCRTARALLTVGDAGRPTARRQ